MQYLRQTFWCQVEYTPRMKIEGHGQAKILTQQEIELLFNEGLQSDRDRALFGVCPYTACHLAEACSLKVIDVSTPAGVIRSGMIIHFRQNQRQARHPHYRDHSRVETDTRE
jgi:integrase/recombinase XerD